MRLTASAAVAVAVLVCAPSATAQTIDIPSAAHLTIVGESRDLGATVDGAGDVNGDGVPDVIVVDRFGGDVGETRAAYVVFGRRTPATVNLASLGSAGFRIDGEVFEAAGAGDVNGDGLADVVVSVRFQDFMGRTNAGSAYVVFGKSTTTPVDLAALGGGGFQIGGPRSLSTGGLPFVREPVDGAGDVNGDGRSDVIVGFFEGQCLGMVPSCNDQAGSAFVVYGKATATTVDTAALGSGGFAIQGQPVGAAVAGLGDANGDGIPDVATSRRWADSGWVVFGRRPASNVDLNSLGTQGFRLFDSFRTDVGGGRELDLQSVAWSLAGLGEVNGDGRRDLLVGIGGFTEFSSLANRAAVVFGGSSTATLDTANPGSRGYQIVGNSALGDGAAAGGDVNGDGRGDALVDGGPDLGIVAVFGKSSTATVDVTNLGGQGLTLEGAPARSWNGAGDMTGDGVADVVVGAPQGEAGRAYVVSARPTALRRLDELRFTIAGFGLPTDLRDRFFRRLDAIKTAYLGGHHPATCRRIERLVGLAQRLNGTRLTGAQAYTIVAGAGRVRNAAGCG